MEKLYTEKEVDQIKATLQEQHEAELEEIKREVNEVRLEWFRSIIIKKRVEFMESEDGVLNSLQEEIERAHKLLTPPTNQ